MFSIKNIIKNLLPYGFLKIYWKKKRITQNHQNIHFNTFYNMSISIRKSLKYIPSDIDLVVGIPRSGMIPAYMIALFLNKPCCSFTEFKNNIPPEHGERNIRYNSKYPQKILIVDDSICSGTALEKIKQSISKYHTNQIFLYYAVFSTPEAKNKVDYYAEIIELPRIFQWNYMYHSIVNKSCLDFDGILCEDPSYEDNDDGDRYKRFLLTAKPLYIPNTKIHAIVTSRLEKYRHETELWLQNHNIQYDKLIMLDLPDARTRQRSNAHALFKADIYKNDKDAILFIESNDKQARDIAKLSGKACICLETDPLYE